MRPAHFFGKLVWYIAGVCWLCYANPVCAQLVGRWQNLSAPRFQHLNLGANLAQTVTNAIAEDEDGFLWVGTQGGLVRWDGYRHKLYLPKAGDPHALPDNWVQVLHLAPNGRLWIGTSGGGLAYHDRLQEHFTTLAVGPGGISHVGVNALADDGAGGLWVATEGGLDHLDAQGVVTHVRHDARDPDSLISDNISEVKVIEGKLWVGSSKGLQYRDAKIRHNRGFANLPLADYGQDGVHSLLQASDGRLWIGTRNHGALVLEPGASQARYTLQTKAKALGEWIYKMLEVRPGEIWLGTYGVGIIVVDGKTGRHRTLRHEAGLENSLADDSVWGLYKGRAGLIWVGTNRGLDWYDSGQTGFLTIPGVAVPDDAKVAARHIADRDVMSVRAMPDGRIWLGLRNNGIDIFDPVQGRVAALRPDSEHPQRALQADSVFAMVPNRERNQDEVMLATNRGLYRSNKKGDVVQRLGVPGRSELESVRVLQQDGENWWLGGDIDGLWYYTKKLNPATLPTLPKLSDQRVSVFEAGVDGMWIGTWNGLNWFDPKRNTLRLIPTNPADPHMLSGGSVASMLTDKRGRLWVGTQGSGVHVLTNPDAAARGVLQFRRISLEQGLPNANVGALLEDDAGQIWVSTDHGLAVINPDTLQVRAFGRADGLIVNGYWSNSAAKTEQGELLFGGVGGLTVVRPALVRQWQYQPPLLITEVRVAGKPIRSSQFNPGPHQPSAGITLDEHNNSFAVEFSALDFSAPEQNRYAYRLDGYDSAWIDTDASRRVAAYTNLAPGDYRLRIRGSNRQGAWNETELSLPIRVIASWYQTGWWKALQVVLGLLLLMGLVQVRTRYLSRRQRKLEQEIASRTAELHEKQAQLMQQEKLAALGGLVTGVAHEINTPLGVVLSAMSGAQGGLLRIQAALAGERTSKSELESATRESLEYTGLAISNGARTAALIDSFKAMAARFESDRVEQLDLALYLPEVAELIRSDLTHSGHQLQIDVSPGLSVHTIPAALSEVLIRVFANVSDHAFVEGFNGCLSIVAYPSGSEVCIEVRDNGIGIAPQHLGQVFDPFFTTQRGLRGHIGLGLTVAHSHLTQRLQARIDIQSEPDKGTCVRIYLPT